MSTTITLQPGETVTVTASSTVTPPGEPLPVDPPEVGEDISFQGDLAFTGVRFDTTGVTGPPMVAALRIAIPNPLPEGYANKVAQISVFENGNGTVWRHATLSQTAGDMGPSIPAAAGSTGPNLYLIFNASDPSMVTVAAGEVWYLNVKMELWTAFSSPPYQPTVSPEGNANFGVKLYPPS